MVTNPSRGSLSRSSTMIAIFSLRSASVRSLRSQAMVRLSGRLPGRGQRALDLGDLEGLQHVVLADVVVAGEVHAALVVLAHFLDVVLEALEAVEAAGPDHAAVAREAH